MSHIDKLKNFFKDLNNCTSIDGIEKSLSELVNKKIILHIFDESIEGGSVSADYFNTLGGNVDYFEKFIDGKPLTYNKKTVYPILLKEQLIGCLEFPLCSASEMNNLEIASQVVALKIDNIRLSNKISKSLDFNNAMKNIAKIIETQYELSYILPIIGEILDTFVENHLIYIFLKQNNKLKLAWPSSCLDDKISRKISKLGNNKEVELSRNRKIGYAEILKFATLDALTGFYNRRQLDERVKQEVSQAKRKGSSLCAIMADIDYFKHVNDTYGHAAGDLVLKTIAKIMRSQLREYDIAARYGGEEFVILLPYTTVTEAKLVAERLLKSVNSKVIDIEKVNTKNKTKTISVSISIGICEYNHEDKYDQLVMKADKALYEAKETGRNRIVFYQEH